MKILFNFHRVVRIVSSITDLPGSMMVSRLEKHFIEYSVEFTHRKEIM